jgi:aminoglycoside phosphotransferase (APT) family kinase protein
VHRPLVDGALARYGEFVQLLDGLPQGVIHGEFFGKNVLLRPDRATPITVVDWETAAMGPLYVDLVSISAGRWTRSQRMAMRRAYFEARNPPVADDADWNRFNQEVDLVALLQAVSWLGFWVSSDGNDPKYTSRVSRWIHELTLAMAEDALA